MCTGLNVSSESLRQRERVSPSDRLRRTAYVQKVRFRIRQCISTLPAPHTTFIALFRVRMNGPLNTVDTKRVSVSYTRWNAWANRLSSSFHQRNCKACNTLELSKGTYRLHFKPILEASNYDLLTNTDLWVVFSKWPPIGLKTGSSQQWVARSSPIFEVSGPNAFSLTAV